MRWRGGKGGEGTYILPVMLQVTGSSSEPSRQSGKVSQTCAISRHTEFWSHANSLGLQPDEREGEKGEVALGNERRHEARERDPAFLSLCSSLVFSLSLSSCNGYFLSRVVRL